MRSFILILGLLLSHSVMCQDPNGFYGIKRYISFDAQYSNPFLYNARHKGELLDFNLENTKATNMLNYHITYSHILADNFAFSLEFGTSSFDFSISHNTKVYAPEVYASSFFSKNNKLVTQLKASVVQVRSFTFLPIFEFARNHGLMPSGIFHQFGLGYSRTHLLDKQYKIQVSGMSNDILQQPFQESYVPTNFYDYKGKSIQSLVFLYGLVQRVPLSKHILFNYGIRYMLYMPLNFRLHLNGESSDAKSSEYIFSNSEASEQLNVRLFQSAIHLNVGLTYGW